MQVNSSDVRRKLRRLVPRTERTRVEEPGTHVLKSAKSRLEHRNSVHNKHSSSALVHQYSAASSPTCLSQRLPSVRQRADGRVK